MQSELCIAQNYDLPDHTAQLEKVEEIIEKYKKRLKLLQKQKNIDDNVHNEFYEEIIRVLDYLGRLSTPAFDIRDEMQAMYFKFYKNYPELAKKLFFDHYGELHKYYDLYKNRCFKLLEDLDKIYFQCQRKNPPNWNI